MHPYMAFIDITKAFDLVSRRGLLKILKKIGCAPRLLNIIASFYEDTHSKARFKGATSEAFPVSSVVKQGCTDSNTKNLESYYHCFSSVRSATAMRRFTITQEQMASSSTLPDFAPKRRSGISCCSRLSLCNSPTETR